MAIILIWIFQVAFLLKIQMIAFLNGLIVIWNYLGTTQVRDSDC
jgi:hypothetical protein